MAGRQSHLEESSRSETKFNESTISAIVGRVYSSLNEVQSVSATPNLGVRTNTTSTSNHSNSVEEEMSQRFSLPRGSSRGQGKSLILLEVALF